MTSLLPRRSSTLPRKGRSAIPLARAARQAHVAAAVDAGLEAVQHAVVARRLIARLAPRIHGIVGALASDAPVRHAVRVDEARAARAARRARVAAAVDVGLEPV